MRIKHALVSLATLLACVGTSYAEEGVVSAAGYGAPPQIEGLSGAQRRLMSMRASKLDAYRALAETVQGFRLAGSTTVAALSVQNDSFRIYVDAYLRGARVVSMNALPEGAYETLLELDMSKLASESSSSSFFSMRSR
jgi:outer membrane protein FlgP